MTAKDTYTMKGKIWLYPGETASWHFITLPKKEGTLIKAAYAPLRRGFGSLPVMVTIGKTCWDTSIFPDSHSGSYLLPLKASVRKKEELLIDDTVTFTLSIRR